MVIGSVHSNEFTCTLDNILTCNLIDSGAVRDQSIIPPASSAGENVNSADDVDVASFNEPTNYLTDNTF